jgi:hypothetical protein
MPARPEKLIGSLVGTDGLPQVWRLLPASPENDMDAFSEILGELH